MCPKESSCPNATRTITHNTFVSSSLARLVVIVSKLAHTNNNQQKNESGMSVYKIQKFKRFLVKTDCHTVLAPGFAVAARSASVRSQCNNKHSQNCLVISGEQFGRTSHSVCVSHRSVLCVLVYCERAECDKRARVHANAMADDERSDVNGQLGQRVFAVRSALYVCQFILSFVPLQLSADTKRIYICRNSQTTQKTLTTAKSDSFLFPFQLQLLEISLSNGIHFWLVYTFYWRLRMINVKIDTMKLYCTFCFVCRSWFWCDLSFVCLSWFIFLLCDCRLFWRLKRKSILIYKYYQRLWLKCVLCAGERLHELFSSFV